MRDTVIADLLMELLMKSIKEKEKHIRKSKIMKDGRTKVKVLSADDLATRHIAKKRVANRLLLCALFVFIGFFLYFMSALPLLANKAVPINWVNEANNNGLSSELLSEGLKLLANGRIEVLPRWISWIFAIPGTFFVWMSFITYENRKSKKMFGDAFTVKYWTTFYPFRDRNIIKI